MSNVLKNVVPLYIIYKHKLITPSMNATRTRGNLDQALAVVRLTSAQLESSPDSKNITVCSSSCKNQEVSGIPSFTCREGKDCIISTEEEEWDEDDEWIMLPYHPDIEQFTA